jgi:hypothetical protein
VALLPGLTGDLLAAWRPKLVAEDDGMRICRDCGGDFQRPADLPPYVPAQRSKVCAEALAGLSTAAVPLHTLALEDALEARRLRGIAHYRNGDASRPFVGDAAAEAFEEVLDLLVYAREMRVQGDPMEVVDHVADLARQVADALGAMLRAPRHRAPRAEIPEALAEGRP